MGSLSPIQTIAIWALPVIFAIVFHEVAHGWVADKLGDKTARLLGRLTLNPIKHMDLFGTIIVPGILLLTGAGFLFGWAKPVPANPKNLHPKKWGIVLVAIAGPFSNLLMAFAWAGIAKLAILMNNPDITRAISGMGFAGIQINIFLMVLNLIPIPPLDGSKVLSNILPGRMAYQYDRLERFGFLILIVLIFTNILTPFIVGPARLLINMILMTFGLS